MRTLIIVIFSLFLIACSSSVKVIEREVPVIVETSAVSDTVTLRDTVDSNDYYLFGVISDSLKNELGNLKVFFEKKMALLSLKPKVDTITVHLIDTVRIKETQILPIVTEQLLWYEKLILFSGIGLILSFLIYLRVKKIKI